MDIHNHNLNIHYSIPENLWNELVEMFAQLPHYRGFSDGCPQWYGCDGKLIEASLETSGLQFYAELPQEEWDDGCSLEKLYLKLVPKTQGITMEGIL